MLDLLFIILIVAGVVALLVGLFSRRTDRHHLVWGGAVAAIVGAVLLYLV